MRRVACRNLLPEILWEVITTFIPGGQVNKAKKIADVGTQLKAFGKELLGICFLKGNLISTPMGLIPIEKIKKDDQVWSWNEKTNWSEFETISDLIENNSFEDPVQSIVDNKIYRSIALPDLTYGDQFIANSIEYKVEFDVVIQELIVRKTGRIIQEVVQTFVNETHQYYKVTYTNSKGDSGTLQVTSEHPFFSVDEKAYLPLRDFLVGMELLSPSGEAITVTGFDYVDETATIYNFEVKGVHNYFVQPPGSQVEPVLVHNISSFTKSTNDRIIGDLGLKDGMKVKTDKALDLAIEFLDPTGQAGYVDKGKGRFVSKDGTRVVRMGDADITGAHAGGPHMNFETLIPHSKKPGKFEVDINLHIYIKD